MSRSGKEAVYAHAADICCCWVLVKSFTSPRSGREKWRAISGFEADGIRIIGTALWCSPRLETVKRRATEAVSAANADECNDVESCFADSE